MILHLDRPLRRSRYFAICFLLFSLKLGLDRFVLASYLPAIPWIPWDYFLPTSFAKVWREPLFFALMVLTSLPFVSAGGVLSIRRLADVGLPRSLIALFLIPAINALFFILLSVLPSKEYGDTGATRFDRFMPRGRLGSALLAVVLSSSLGVALTYFSANMLTHYGWTLFISVPFLCGLLSALIYSYRSPRTQLQCVAIAFSSLVVAGLMILLLVIEGFICIAMTFPIVLLPTSLGGVLGYVIQRYAYGSRAHLSILILPVILPLHMTVEAFESGEPPLVTVTTSEVIHAPPEVVWENVVAFSEIAEPHDWIFWTGLAYPKRARIEEAGVGAVRYCEFSTGSFVEPIEVWDPPRRLAFSVRSQPAPMKEWSIYADLHPAHLEGFFLSRRGEFRLIPQSDGRTLLEGTTWYVHRVWPMWYWTIFSDYILHRIHQRVLTHIKDQAETQ